MDAVVKKKMINFFFDVLIFFTFSLAFLCLFLKLQNIFPICFENINLLAVKSVFSRSKRNIFSDLKGNLYLTYENNNIEDFKDNTIIKQENDFKKLTPSNVNLPDLSTEPDEEEYHDQNEKTYKIIESQVGSGGIKHENFFVKNTTGINIDIGCELSKEPEINIKNISDPQVLIFHTHTSESYMRQDTGFFYESFYPRSLKNEKNVTRVGKAITEKLIENGINTVHDTTYNDNPTYNGSYARAAQTIKRNLEKYPSIQVVIDIHRDSLGSKETGKIKPTFKYQGKKAAQMMVISGCDPDGSIGFPNWEKNLRLALRVQKYCESLFPGITRPLNFSNVKYNEHITPGSLLIEVGSDVNTLEEAVYTGSMIGEALSKLLNDLKK